MFILLSPSFVKSQSLNVEYSIHSNRIKSILNSNIFALKEKSVGAKLTAADVLEIRKRLMTGVEYAKKYGVSKSAIYEIWRGKNWASL